MGVDIRIDGSVDWDASELSVSESSTPLDPSDNGGGAGEVSFMIPARGDSRLLSNLPVLVEDGARGDTSGVIRAAAGDRARVRVSAFTRVAALVAERTAAPQNGTIESVLTYYLGLCGITTGITVDAAIAGTPVVVVGWYASVWDQLKKFCIAYRFEITLVGDAIIARPPRGVRASRVQESAFSWALDESNLARSVAAWYYEPTAVTGGLVLGDGDMSPVSNLGASAVHEFEVRLNVSLSSVSQPVAADSVALEYASSSVYAVVDAFDEPVSATEWEAAGGRVTVEVLEDTRGLRVTVVGAANTYRAPYRLVGLTDAGEEYSTLRVVGSGVSFKHGRYSLPACLDERATVEVGHESDNEFLTSWGEAHTALLGAVARYGGGFQKITASAQDLLLTGAAQAFGNMAGARVREGDAEYRIRSVSSSPGGVSWSAESDTTVADLDALWAGKTNAEWAAVWGTATNAEFLAAPLTPIP